MIKPGTLCVIVNSQLYPEDIGRFCEFIAYCSSWDGRLLPSGTDCIIRLPGIKHDFGDDRWAATSSNLLPIQPDADTQLQFEVEREHV